MPDKLVAEYLPIVSDTCDLEITVPDDIHLCDGDDFDFCGTITYGLSDTEYVWLEDGVETGLDLYDFQRVAYSKEDWLILESNYKLRRIG